MDKLKREYIELAKSGEYEVCIWGAGFFGTQKGLELLNKRGIHADYYCDNNSELWGREIIDGIRCISPEELQIRREKVVCFLFLRCTAVESVLEQMRHMQIKRIVLFDDLFVDEKEEYFPFMKRNHIAFYTCVVGDYDDLQEPLSVLPECDYYLISDKKPQKDTIYQYLDINQYLPEDIIDNTKKNRYCKINAHKIFPQYRYSIYFDGQIQIDSSIAKYLRELPKIRIMTSFRNYWSGLYMEAMRVILNNRDSEDVVRQQIEHYWLEGMPEDFGSVYCNIILREHNNPICRKLMEDWWGQVKQFSKRDMISFPYVIWKNGYEISDVKTVVDKFQFETKYWKDAGRHNRPRVVYEGKDIY